MYYVYELYIIEYTRELSLTQRDRCFQEFYAKQRPWSGYKGPWYGEFYREDFACSNNSTCDCLYPSITDIPSFHWSHWPSKVGIDIDR